MRRIKKILIIFIFLLSTIFTTGCIFVRTSLKDKIDFEGFWKCEEYNFTMDIGTRYAYMDYEDKSYEFGVAFGDGGNSIVLYDLIGDNGELFDCGPKISKKKDSFTIDIGDCYINEISNKTLKFVHISRDELLKDNTVYEKFINNKNWINNKKDVSIKLSDYILFDNKLVINKLEYRFLMLKNYKKIYINARDIDGERISDTFGIFEVEDTKEGIQLEVMYFYDETILKTGDVIILLPKDE